MNESEARSKIKYRIEVAREIAGNGVDGKAFEDLEIAIQALKEIREYRAIGTPTQIYEKIGGLDVELGKYRSIGTVEEFKAFRSDDFTQDLLNMGYTKGLKDGYAKAIDEFAERIKQGDVIEYMGSYVSYKAIVSFIDEIAEQMKGGAE